MISEYVKTVDEYLTEIGVKVIATKTSGQACPGWGECKPTYLAKTANSKIDHNHGFEYRIELKRLGDIKGLDQATSLGSFWSSINDSYTLSGGRPLERYGKPPAYDVLSAFMCNSYTNQETFEDFCRNFGYDTDSRKAEETYRACLEISIKLQRFFTTEELEKLGEIAQ